MSKAEYWQRGEALDYTNATDTLIPANTIVQIGSHIGVTGTDIAPGEVGSLHVGGVWEIEKTGTQDIAMGQAVYFDGKGITDATGDGNVEAGYAAAPAKAADTTILVKLRG